MPTILLRTPIGLLVLCCALFASVPSRQGIGAEFRPDQQQAIQGIIHDYLMKHPEVLTEALQRAEAKLKSDAGEKAKQALVARRNEIFDDPQTPVGGNPKGDVTLVEFFDYRCPYCKRMHPALRELLAADRKLRIAYKEWPILGPVSVTAARAALAAHLQGKYEAFHNSMMTATGEITEDTVYRIAGSVGLDLERLKRDMASPQVEAALKANRDLASALDIHGTPAFVVGDQIVPGAIDLSAIEDLVAGARKK